MKRIGVTGHRTFDDVDGTADAIDGVLAGLVADEVQVWSSLAEGADRLVAERAMARGASLVVVLPLRAAEYRKDFADPLSVAEFDRLVGAASEVHLARPDDPTREAAYEAAGREMLGHIDVLIAVWDGAPARGRGGTAQIVGEARALGIEVAVVPVTRDNV